ncbi:MAG: glycosyl hydrolase 115 family protein [Nibricoccus sp.]
MMRYPRIATALFFFFGLFAFINPLAADTATWVSDTAKSGDFPLVHDGRTVPIRYSTEDYKVVEIAAQDLAADVERVTGFKPVVITATGDGMAKGKVAPHAIWIGTLGKSPLIDGLVSAGKVDVTELRGKWESFLIATVESPQPGVKQALVIVGSDRRGTAYGVYELSQAIGVSPWYWWADVVPEKKNALYVASGTRRFGPPSVQYRGIFINDEDWGLQPWAAKTFAPEEGGIGPKVYKKVFELLLRLKANTLWPAMHACTKPFNAFPENARLADDYAIVMGSSHAEPMLRNNVGEWTAPKDAYNYIANRDGVLKYWDERLASNGKFENVYTLGMRGIHDSNMVGPKTDEERIAALERIFADQRAMIAKYARPEVEQVPQMFCAYKEVLDLYRKGLKVPDDVTIMWPDDNFGYIRNFATPEEQKRSGGFGVYYHISYLGRPLAYLWLCTTPPALIWEEMNKAYEHGARKMWIVNVGDIKPAEIDTEFFLQMAWDIKRWNRENLPEFLVEWATREFGAQHAKEIADVMTTYYQLNYQRKPEHLQWWLPKETPRASTLTAGEHEERLVKFADISARVQKLTAAISEKDNPSFTELVGYPILASAAANERYLYGEMDNAVKAIDANSRLDLLTRHFNETITSGKWRHFIQLEPADNDWKSMRIARWEMSKFPTAVTDDKGGTTGIALAVEAENFTRKTDRASGGWQVVPGLGRTGAGSLTVMPFAAKPVAIEQAKAAAPAVEYDFTLPAFGAFILRTYLIPTHPTAGDALRFAVALDDGEPQLVELAFKDGSAEWAQGVLDNTRIAQTTLTVPTAGAHTLRVYGLEPGVVIDKFVLFTGEPPRTYLGPPETRMPAK